MHRTRSFFFCPAGDSDSVLADPSIVVWWKDKNCPRSGPNQGWDVKHDGQGESWELMTKVGHTSISSCYTKTFRKHQCTALVPSSFVQLVTRTLSWLIHPSLFDGRTKIAHSCTNPEFQIEVNFTTLDVWPIFVCHLAMPAPGQCNTQNQQQWMKFQNQRSIWRWHCTFVEGRVEPDGSTKLRPCFDHIVVGVVDWWCHRFHALRMYTSNSQAESTAPRLTQKLLLSEKASPKSSSVWQPWKLEICATVGELEDTTTTVTFVDSPTYQGLENEAPASSSKLRISWTRCRPILSDGLWDEVLAILEEMHPTEEVEGQEERLWPVWSSHKESPNEIQRANHNEATHQSVDDFLDYVDHTEDQNQCPIATHTNQSTCQHFFQGDLNQRKSQWRLYWLTACLETRQATEYFWHIAGGVLCSVKTFFWKLMKQLLDATSLLISFDTCLGLPPPTLLDLGHAPALLQEVPTGTSMSKPIRMGLPNHFQGMELWGCYHHPFHALDSATKQLLLSRPDIETEYPVDSRSDHLVLLQVEENSLVEFGRLWHSAFFHGMQNQAPFAIAPLPPPPRGEQGPWLSTWSTRPASGSTRRPGVSSKPLRPLTFLWQTPPSGRPPRKEEVTLTGVDRVSSTLAMFALLEEVAFVLATGGLESWTMLLLPCTAPCSSSLLPRTCSSTCCTGNCPPLRVSDSWWAWGLWSAPTGSSTPDSVSGRLLPPMHSANFQPPSTVSSVGLVFLSCLFPRASGTGLTPWAAEGDVSPWELSSPACSSCGGDLAWPPISAGGWPWREFSSMWVGNLEPLEGPSAGFHSDGIHRKQHDEPLPKSKAPTCCVTLLIPNLLPLPRSSAQMAEIESDKTKCRRPKPW